MSLLRPSASPGGAGVGGAQQRGGSSPPARQDPLRSGALFRMASPAPRLLKPAVARGGVASPGGVAQVAAQQGAPIAPIRPQATSPAQARPGGGAVWGAPPPQRHPQPAVLSRSPEPTHTTAPAGAIPAPIQAPAAVRGALSPSAGAGGAGASGAAAAALGLLSPLGRALPRGAAQIRANFDALVRASPAPRVLRAVGLGGALCGALGIGSARAEPTAEPEFVADGAAEAAAKPAGTPAELLGGIVVGRQRPRRESASETAEAEASPSVSVSASEAEEEEGEEEKEVEATPKADEKGKAQPRAKSGGSSGGRAKGNASGDVGGSGSGGTATRPKRGGSRASKAPVAETAAAKAADTEEEEDDGSDADAPPLAPVGATCELCAGAACGRPNSSTKTDPLLQCGRRVVHERCAVWCPEVYYGDRGALLNVDAACRRSRRLRCAHCGVAGATVGCHNSSCRRVYHLPCVRAAGCKVNTSKYEVRCPKCATITTAASGGSVTGASPSKPNKVSSPAKPNSKPKAAPKAAAAVTKAKGKAKAPASPPARPPARRATVKDKGKMEGGEPEVPPSGERALERASARTRSGRTVIKAVPFWEGAVIEKSSDGSISGVRRGVHDFTGTHDSGYLHSTPSPSPARRSRRPAPAGRSPASASRGGGARTSRAATKAPKRKDYDTPSPGSGGGGSRTAAAKRRKIRAAAPALPAVPEGEPTPSGAAGGSAAGGATAGGHGDDPVDAAGWRVSEVEALYAAHAAIAPTAPNFWQKVARHVPGRSSNDCFTRFFATHPTPAAGAGKPKAKSRKGGGAGNCGSGVANPAGAIAAAAPPPPKRATITAVRKRARELHEEARAADAAHAAEAGLGKARGAAAAAGTAALARAAGGGTVLVGSDVLRRGEDRSGTNAYVESYLKRNATGKRKQARAGGSGGSGSGSSGKGGGGGKRFKDMASILAEIRSAEASQRAADEQEEDALNGEEDFYFSD